MALRGYLKGALGMAAGVALLGAAVSTGALAQDKVTIRVAHPYTGQDATAPFIKKALDDYEAAHPNVNLVREETAGDDHRTKLSTDLAANNTADVFFNWMTPAAWQAFIDAGVLLPVDEYFKLSKKVSAADWTPAQLDAVRVNGTVYSLPTAGFKCFTLYNTSLFTQYGQKPPTTLDELYAVSKAFNDAGVVPMDTGSKGGNPGHLFYNEVLSQLPGGQEAAAASNTSYDVSAKVFRDAAHIIKDMKDNGVFPKDTIANGDWSPSIALYNQGKASMLFTCPWMIGAIDPAIAAVSDFMYFPTVPGSVVDPKTFNVGNVNNGWEINKASFEDPAKQALIVDLVDALLSPEVKQGMAETGTFPWWNAGDISKYKLNPLTAKMFTFTATAPATDTAFVAYLPNAGILNAYLDAMDRLFAGDDPDAVFDDFQAATDREKP